MFCRPIEPLGENDAGWRNRAYGRNPRGCGQSKQGNECFERGDAMFPSSARRRGHLEVVIELRHYRDFNELATFVDLSRRRSELDAELRLRG
jgi:hypothetical protein